MVSRERRKGFRFPTKRISCSTTYLYKSDHSRHLELALAAFCRISCTVAPRRLPTTPVNSASGIPAACTLRLDPGRSQLLDILYAADGVAHSIDSHIFLVLILDVFSIGGLKGLEVLKDFSRPSILNEGARAAR